MVIIISDFFTFRDDIAAEFNAYSSWANLYVGAPVT